MAQNVIPWRTVKNRLANTTIIVPGANMSGFKNPCSVCNHSSLRTEFWETMPCNNALWLDREKENKWTGRRLNRLRLRVILPVWSQVCRRQCGPQRWGSSGSTGAWSRRLWVCSATEGCRYHSRTLEGRLCLGIKQKIILYALIVSLNQWPTIYWTWRKY